MVLAFTDLLWLVPAFFAVAVLYSAAGFGGGSSYLALLALSALPVGMLRPLALLCNLAVTGSGSYSFARDGITPWRRALPLVAASTPAAFLGGRVSLPPGEYLLLLAVLLIVAGLLMLLRKNSVDGKGGPKKWATVSAVVIGAVVGFVSGVVGIGGGIFLSPLLFLTAWATAKKIAATTSLFIFVNSVAGLIGQLSVGLRLDLSVAGWLLGTVLVGGLLGTRLTLTRFSPATIRKLAALLILLVGGRLLYSNWPL